MNNNPKTNSVCAKNALTDTNPFCLERYIFEMNQTYARNIHSPWTHELLEHTHWNCGE